MHNKKLNILILILVLVGVFTISYFTTKKEINISDNKAIADLNGKKIGSLTITKDNLKSLKIIDKKVNGQSLKVTSSINISDSSHKLEGNVVLNYTKKDNKWLLDTVTNVNHLQDTLNKIGSSIKTIPFTKSSNQILQDLETNNSAIPIIDLSVSLTFGRNDALGLVPLVKRTFKIEKIENQNTGMSNQKLITVFIDVNFTLNDPHNMYEHNGNYNGKGQIKVLYTLGGNNSVWNLLAVGDTSKIKVTKK
ncbi:hypothetical protein [Clostridium estertheticum]|uniref:hypothetical protein n=1 Tax=Clostridium estertheticum TaxID=238834 RepID=UPI001C0BD2C6|nr:hypothetical protein [Clostridium estertheticum]MBU3173308.1 hypothetical protein [Clostridium estertheticum]